MVNILLMGATLVSLANPVPVLWNPRTTTEMTPVTVIPWAGKAHISGAFLLSRINLSFINQTCSRFSSDLDVATQVARVLADSKMIGSTTNQVRRYGFVMLKLETDFKEVIDYLTSLLLCAGRGGELWTKFSDFKNQASLVWIILRKAGLGASSPHNIADSRPLTQPLTQHSSSPILIDNRTPLSNDSSDLGSLPLVNNPLLDFLEAARPEQSVRPRSPILIGLGLGFLGNYLLSQYFGNNNDDDIEILNQNIQKQNQNIKVTNERIDILAKNVSNSVNVIKNILDKLLEAQETADLHYAILWNLDQLVSSITNIMNSFKFGELAITLLNKGILNAELIELQSFERIIVEGRKSFPQLDFPLSIGRYELPHIVKILKVQRIAHLKFLMVIPLTSKQEYEVFSIIPHPVKLGPNALVLPDLRNIILVDNNTYIITDNINVYSISLQHHLLLEVEPIYNKMKSTCEWEAFKLNNTAMIELCSYHKIGQLKDTVVIETDQHRLVYFSEPT